MSVVTLSEARDHLNITSTSSDGELQEFLDRAEAAIGHPKKCGPLSVQSYTERVRGESPSLIVKIRPAVSLTSVTPYGGTPMDLTDLNISPNGTIEQLSGCDGFGSRWYDVVYTAGRTSLTDDLKLGVLELVRHFWDTQRGTSLADQGPFGNVQEGDVMIRGGIPIQQAFTFPKRVEQLIDDEMQLPGFA